MIRAVCCLLFLSGPSLAGGLVFAPDRPAVGESASSPGRGHVVIEGGFLAQIAAGDVVVGTSAVTGRFGLGRGVEARLRLPDFVLGGDRAVGAFGIGAKVGGDVGEQLGASVIPELVIDPVEGIVGLQTNTNIVWSVGPLSARGHTSFGVLGGELNGLVGGGAGVGVPLGGAYVNGSYGFGGGALVGAGAWWSPGKALQFDAGCDLLFREGMPMTILPTVGVSVGF